ncbi:sepiapterin reductase-like [Gigantopelta aegis]|uniref:sepiapterin reductase-like n=1 Tax=Gigantopelta aegis TaxID=1735272 RepID=UPI001B888F2A|nr:sepiapterin reductase-like [Gigantopelta aegis]
MFSGKTVCIITGASRGLGKSIALNFSNLFTKDSVFILLARDDKSLSDTKQAISQKCVTQYFDQGTLDQSVFDSLLPRCLNELHVNTEEFEHACIVHNAGTLECEMTEDLVSVQSVSNYFNVNLIGAVALNASFLRVFQHVEHKLVIGISSLAALQPINSWALYCSAKAARDMYFKHVASEYPAIRVLNYAPGPLRTDMLTKTACTESKDPQVLKVFKDLAAKALSCDTSVLKLIEILKGNKFKNGDHVDYYDE